MRSLGDRRLVLVTGKGGVGKTTVSAALATSLASRGKRVLVAMCHTKERLSTMLDVPPIGAEIVEVRKNLFAVNMDPELAIEEYGRIRVKSRAIYKLLFDNQYVRAFFRATPGLSEWSMLGKAWWHTTEELSPGRNKYDVVILDAPATGHGLDMLRVPKVILEVTPPGLLRRDAEEAWALFRDESRCGVAVVTLPEEMPTQETLELVEALDTDLEIPIAEVFVNAVLEPLFTPAERGGLAALSPSLGSDSASEGFAALVPARSRAIREDIQERCIERLRTGLKKNPPIKKLPYCFGEDGRARTDTLAKELGNT